MSLVLRRETIARKSSHTYIHCAIGEPKKVQWHVRYTTEVLNELPELSMCFGVMDDVCVEKENVRIRVLQKAAYEEVRAKHNAEALKNNPTVRAYRDFYWKLGIDPTKTRPSGEALLRRVLNGNELPSISTIVDAYNLGSMTTLVPISGFDRERLNPPFQVRFARSGEAFTGIGMSKPMTLTGKMLVLADEKQVLCIYPYRDSDRTKITLQTRNIVIVGYGVPGITIEQLREAVETTFTYIKQISPGKVETVKVFSSTSK
jgi:DNA/RNA-binding domain of Phe-tRNA-synthetase-like protein